MADQNTDPYSASETARYNKDFGVSDLEASINKRNKRLRRNLVAAPGFNDMFDSFLNKQKPVEGELKAAAQTLNDIENPYIRRQLVRSAQDSINQRRDNVAGQYANVLQARLQGQQSAITNDQTDLTRRMSDRDQARGLAGQDYMDQLQRRRSLEDIRKQDALSRELQIGQYAPKTYGGGGGQGSDYKFVTLPDGTFGSYDPDTGQFIPQGNAPAAQKSTIVTDPITGEMYEYDPVSHTKKPIQTAQTPQQSGAPDTSWMNYMPGVYSDPTGEFAQ